MPECQPGVTDQQVRVRTALKAEALASGAPAERAVERIIVRVQRLVTRPALVARQVLRKLLDGPLRFVFFEIDKRDQHHAFTETERLFHGFGDAGSRTGAHDVPIDDNFDAVLAFVVDCGRLVEVERTTIDAHSCEPRPADFIEQRLVLFLPLTLDWGHDVDLRPFWHRENSLDDFVASLRANRDATLRAISLAEPRVKDAQIVVNFGDRTDGRTRAFARRFLFDANRRRQSRNLFDARLLNLAEKLSRVTRQRFDVTTLPLRINRVECQRTFARTRRPAEYGHLVSRDAC